MNSCELTASITALANFLVCNLDNKSAALLASVFVQLGDSIVTILTHKDLCENQSV